METTSFPTARCVPGLLLLLLTAASPGEDAPAIRGRAVDDQGGPVAGARVAPLFTFGGGGRVESGRTGPDGGFTLACNRGGVGAELVADLEGYAPGLHEGEARCGGEPVTIVLRKGATLAGTVTDQEGAPLAGARVALDLGLHRISHSEGAFPGDSIRQARTGPDGRYELRDLPTGLVHLRATALGYGVAAEEVRLTPGKTAALAFRLPHLGTVRGVVVEAGTGVPIEGAEIDPDGAVTDRAGAFTVTRRVVLAPPIENDGGPRIVLTAAKPGHAPRTVSILAAEADRGMRIELTRAATLRGHVVDPDGKPASGATVLFEGPGSVYVTAGADGAFRDDAFPPGAYRKVLVLSGSWPELERPGFTVAPGEDRTLDLVVGAGPEVRGRAVDRSTGAPVSGAEARVWRGMPSEDGKVTWIVSFSVTAGADGRFRARGLADGPVWITVAAPGRAPIARELDPKAADEARFALEPGLVMEGVVVDAGGKPVEDAYVSLEPDLPEPRRRFLGTFGASTDASGRFRIADLPAEPMRVRAGPPGPGAAPPDQVLRPPFQPLRLVVGR